jgi:FkbM family methyltransferase
MFKKNFLLNLSFKYKIFYKTFLYYNIYIRNLKFFYKNTLSQDKEDLFIKKFFKDKREGTYLDIGCFNPLLWNNTYLLYKKGWHGINVDIQKINIDLFNVARPDDINICCALYDKKKILNLYNLQGENNSAVMTIDKSHAEKMKFLFSKNIIKKKIQTLTFSEMIKNHKITINNIDFLNIDTEGSDFNILRSINIQKYKPKLICIEISQFTKQVDKKKILNYLKSNNYKYIYKTSVSSFFKKINNFSY